MHNSSPATKQRHTARLAVRFRNLMAAGARLRTKSAAAPWPLRQCTYRLMAGGGQDEAWADYVAG